MARVRRAILASVALLGLVAAPMFVSPTNEAEAAVQGFDPGNIISDSVFYDGRAMTVSEIQTFMNQRVPRCTIGDPGRIAGSPWGNTHISDTCLRNFSMTTRTIPGDAYCAPYVGRAGESSAQIIAKVAEACGVSPKVLLVTLEKEQSLVSDTWPTVRQLAVATGYACPDSGPNWAANCNPQYYGFQNQVYYAAWQFKVYKAHPNSFNYKPFQTNTIQWHPNPACGSSQVYIENWATAGLYIYTPYRPNQAALNAGWGIGDECSAYGNRNFYNFFTTWFGSTQGIEVTGAIKTYWQNNRTWLGEPTETARYVSANGGGWLQYFDGGFVYESLSGTPTGFTRSSPIVAAFSRAGGIEGSWGWPLAPAASYGSGNAVVRFQGGAVVETRDVGVFLVPEGVRADWEASGGFTGSWGYPTTNHQSVNGEGTVQNFQHGTLYSSNHGTFFMPLGRIADAYKFAAGPAGDWGWPRGRYLCAADGSSCSMDFSSAVVTWTPLRGVVVEPLLAPNPSNPTLPGTGEQVIGETA